MSWWGSKGNVDMNQLGGHWAGVIRYVFIADPFALSGNQRQFSLNHAPQRMNALTHPNRLISGGGRGEKVRREMGKFSQEANKSRSMGRGNQKKQSGPC